MQTTRKPKPKTGIKAGIKTGAKLQQAARAGTRLPAHPVKRSLTIAGHATSISLEAAFWAALKEAAEARSSSIAALVAEIDRTRGEAGLSSAIRVYLLGFVRVSGGDAPADTKPDAKA